MLQQLKTVTVIGSGTMGNGICHVFAQSGFTVHMMDINQQALDRAMVTIGKNMDRQVTKNTLTEAAKAEALGRITTFTRMAEAVKNADLVIEAATENIDLKLNIFREISAHCPEHTILASNTSSISITRIAAVTKHPEQVIGMHFMNPVPVMKLVEIINGYATDKTVTEQVYKLGMAHPMGPLQLADFIGLDTCHNILNVLYTGFGNQKYAPAALLTNMVQAGYLGAKSGEGFYKYTPGSKDLVVSERFK